MHLVHTTQLLCYIEYESGYYITIYYYELLAFTLSHSFISLNHIYTCVRVEACPSCHWVISDFLYHREKLDK